MSHIRTPKNDVTHKNCFGTVNTCSLLLGVIRFFNWRRI